MIMQEKVEKIVAQILQESRSKGNEVCTHISADQTILEVDEAQKKYKTFSLKKQLAILDQIRSTWLSKIDTLIALSSALHSGDQRDKKALFEHLITQSLDLKNIHSKSMTGDHGLTLIDYSAYGIFLVILPKKHAIETLISHIIPLLSAGNAAIFLTHTQEEHSVVCNALSLIQSVLASYHVEHLVTALTLKDPLWQSLVNHTKTKAIISDNASLLVNQSALIHKKTYISARGSVPVIVDETADLKRAATDIMLGARFDHNLLFCAEKFVVVTSDAYDYFCHTLDVEGGDWQKKIKERLLVNDLNPANFYGQSWSQVAAALNLEPTQKTVGLIPLTEEALETQSYHQYVGIPLLFVIKARDVSHAVAIAQKIDRDMHFMAIMHSKNIDYLSLCAREMQTAIFVKNAPSYAAIGIGGEGSPSLFVANVTGEGLLHPQDYARKRRCILAEGFFIR